jgi:hypothetical protein
VFAAEVDLALRDGQSRVEIVPFGTGSAGDGRDVAAQASERAMPPSGGEGVADELRGPGRLTLTLTLTLTLSLSSVAARVE